MHKAVSQLSQTLLSNSIAIQQHQASIDKVVQCLSPFMVDRPIYESKRQSSSVHFLQILTSCQSQQLVRSRPQHLPDCLDLC